MNIIDGIDLLSGCFYISRLLNTFKGSLVAFSAVRRLSETWFDLPFCRNLIGFGDRFSINFWFVASCSGVFRSKWGEDVKLCDMLHNFFRRAVYLTPSFVTFHLKLVYDRFSRVTFCSHKNLDSCD